MATLYLVLSNDAAGNLPGPGEKIAMTAPLLLAVTAAGQDDFTAITLPVADWLPALQTGVVDGALFTVRSPVAGPPFAFLESLADTHRFLVVDGDRLRTADPGDSYRDLGQRPGKVLTETTSDDPVRLSGGRREDFLAGGIADDRIVGRNGEDVLLGLSGDDVLLAGSGGDILIGGAGNDRMSGGRGADSFVLNDDAGRDTITDFGKGSDVVSFVNVVEITGFRDLLRDHARQSGEDTVIRWGEDNRLVLADVALEDLRRSDFDF